MIQLFYVKNSEVCPVFRVLAPVDKGIKKGELIEALQKNAEKLRKVKPLEGFAKGDSDKIIAIHKEWQNEALQLICLNVDELYSMTELIEQRFEEVIDEAPFFDTSCISVIVNFDNDRIYLALPVNMESVSIYKNFKTEIEVIDITSPDYTVKGKFNVEMPDGKNLLQIIESKTKKFRPKPGEERKDIPEKNKKEIISLMNILESNILDLVY